MKKHRAETPKKYGNILDCIGNTPLVPITRIHTNKRVRLLAKLEQTNPGGSIKDRPALSMIEGAEARGELTKRKTVLEATSGNTGIGLSMICALKGYRLLLTMSESTSKERCQRLEAFGARLELTPAEKSSDGAIEYAYELARTRPDQYFLVDQYNNDDNWSAHQYGTAPEIWNQTGGKVTAIVTTLGTGGTATGISRGIKTYDPHIRVIGVEPVPGHHIQGLKNMKESYVPGIFNKNCLDKCIPVDDKEAFSLVRRLALEEGLFVGMSSGAALAGALRVVRNMSEGTVVVIFPDGGDRYLSTGVFTAGSKVRAGEETPGMHIYNTMTRRTEPFHALKKGKVSMYTCGPTVDGNLNLALSRRLIVADLLKRHLSTKGFKITHIVNITDLDNRIILGSAREGKSPEAFVKPYVSALFNDLDRLGIRRASHYPRTTEHVPEMIKLTRDLLDRGIAYEKNRSVYFDISRYSDYTNFSGIRLAKVKSGLTVDPDRYEKNNPLDFVLFRRAGLKEVKRGVFYDTEWGLGRPGWHIQCAAMSMKYLGENFDIHTSESHLTFPHNENEMAIAGALTGKALARYWVTSAPVMADGRAMFDQPDNRITLRQLMEKGYTERQLRFFLLRTRYRKPLIYNRRNLDDACHALHRLDTFVRKLRFTGAGKGGSPLHPPVSDMERAFSKAMDDDLNISVALAVLFGYVKQVNPLLQENKLGKKDIERLLKGLQRINRVLGVLDMSEPGLDNRIQTLIRKRNHARKQGDWQQADDLRTDLMDDGVMVFDTPLDTI
ncbi:MAG: cysteine--tRNA ligase [Desulfobacterales bacterium]|nr:cysteine--tRNA ligase [Desulfobacterales bacterium]